MKQLWRSSSGRTTATNLLYHWSDEDQDGLKAWGKKFLNQKVRVDSNGWFNLYAEADQINKLVDRGERNNWNKFIVEACAGASIYNELANALRPVVQGRWDISFVFVTKVILRVENDDDAILLRMAGLDPFILKPIA